MTELDKSMNVTRKPTSSEPITAGPRNAAPQTSAVPRARKTYKPPTLARWGTLLEMTRATGNQGNKDGGRRPYQRTR